jgi:predicted RNA-binding Zn-ribbon protein involved in translation (DUF1610 family)
VTTFERPLRATQHCRHYSYRNTGLAGLRSGDHGGPQCALGIDLSAPGASKACMPAGTFPALPHDQQCASRADYTAAERAEWKRWTDSRLERMRTIMPMIPGSSADTKKREHWGDSGSFACPACGTGTVRWSRARSNGHVHAVCTTPNCFGVME